MYSSENDICQLTQGKISPLSSEEVTHFRRDLPKKTQFPEKKTSKNLSVNNYISTFALQNHCLTLIL